MNKIRLRALTNVKMGFVETGPVNMRKGEVRDFNFDIPKVRDYAKSNLFEIVETEETDSEALEKPDESWKKSEIVEYLKENNLDYDLKDTKKQLLARL